MSNKKEKIMEAYIQLLDENPNKRVTVNSIVARCGVSRNTFYYYFPDIPSLIDEIQETWVKTIETSPEPTVLVDCLRPLARYAEEHRSGLLNAYRTIDIVRFRSSMDRLWDAVLRRYIELYGGCSRSDEDRDTLIRFFKSVFIGMTINWLDAEMSYDLIEEGRRICELLRDEDITKKLFALS